MAYQAPPPPARPSNPFDNAQATVDKDRADALNALAQFGRRGLDQAIAYRQQVEQATNPSDIIPGVNPNIGKFNSAMTHEALDPYAAIARNTEGLVSRENNAQAQVTGNYYNQLGQAIPLYRQEAESVITQFQKAYEERQAEIAHQRALEEMALAAAQAAASRGGGGGYGGGGGNPFGVPAPVGPPATIGGWGPRMKSDAEVAAERLWNQTALHNAYLANLGVPGYSTIRKTGAS